MAADLDCRQLVEEIQGVVQAQGIVAVEDVRALAERYARACRDASKRMHECHELLCAGLLSEAVQLCEFEPKLLPVVTVLDFPERTIWADVLRQYHLPLAAELPMDQAAALHRACEKQQQLDPLLREHRRLSVARAPLPLRLGKLRELAAKDASNPVWEQDVRGYERERQKQIGAEVNNAGKSRDLAALGALCAELREPRWLERPAAALVDSASRTEVRVRTELAHEELERIEPLLSAAHAELDIFAARMLRQQWLAHGAAARLAPDDELAQRAEPALEWLDKQDRRERRELEFSAAVAALEQALDQDLPAVEIERRFHALVALGRPIPDVLTRRYAAWHEQSALGQARKHRLWMAGTLSAVVLILLAGGAWMWSAAQEQRIQEHVDAINSFLEDGQPRQAEEYWKASVTTDGALAQEPRLAELHETIKVRVEEAKQRRQMLVRALENAVALAQQGEIRAAETELGKAKPMVTTAEDQREYVEADRIVNRVRNKLQKQRDAQFTTRLTNIGARFDELQEKKLPLGDGVRLQELEKLLNDTQELMAGGEEVSETLRPTGDVRLKILRKEIATEKRLRDERAALAGISDSIGNWNSYRTKLGKFADEHPADGRGVQFKDVLTKEASWWEEMEVWNGLVRTGGGRDVIAMTPKNAAEFVAQLDAARTRRAVHPLLESLEAKYSFCQAIARRASSKPADIQALKAKWQASPMWTDVSMACETANSGLQRYYFSQGSGKSEAGGYSINQLIKRTTSQEFGTKYLSDSDKIVIHDVAPQCQFVKDALAKLEGLQSGQWEQVFHELLVTLDTMPEQEIDPIAKHKLAFDLLEYGCAGSVAMERVYGDHLEALKKLDLGGIDGWPDPKDSDANKRRDEITFKRPLKKFGTWEELKKKLDEELKTASAGVTSGPFVWSGWLRRDEHGEWRCDWPRDKKLEQGERLYVVRERDDKSLELAEIGVVEQDVGRIEAPPVDASLLVEGRPVFIQTKP